jgi:hypothetical protein
LVPGLPAELQVQAWLGEIFGAASHGSDGISILPAKLAALHTLRELAAPEFPAVFLTGATARQRLHAVAFLATADADYRDAAPLLGRILPTLTEGISDLDRPGEVLAAMANVLPCPSPSLAPAAVRLIHRLLEYLPLWIEPAARAYWLSNLGLRLAETGELEEALAIEREAVMIRGELAAAGQGRALADYATSLDRLSGRLSQTGHPDEALAAAQNASARYRELANGDPSAYRPGLAQALTSLSLRYHEQDDLPQCLAAAEDAAMAYRELAMANPGQNNPGRARAVTTLALRHNELKQFTAAVPIAELGIRLYRQLVSTDPGRYKAALAGALDNYGVYLSKAGRPHEALPATKEAVTLYRELARINPGRYQADLTRAQGNLRYRHQQLNPARRK